MARIPETSTGSEAKHLYGELHAACLAKDVNRVRIVLEADSSATLDTTRELRHAIRHPPLMRCLLESGADPSQLDIKQVVLYAESEVAFENLKILADFGYDIGSQGHVVLQDFSKSREAIDWLLDRGVDINKTDPYRTDGGIKLGSETDSSNHLLNRVAAQGDIAMFDHLVSRGADPKKSPALHCATECQDESLSLPMIRHLLHKHHLDIEADREDLRDLFRFLPDSGTALNNAIHAKNLSAIKELLRLGANPNLRRVQPCEQAMGDRLFHEPGFLPALPVLLDAGADPTSALRKAVLRDKIEAARIILGHEVDIASILTDDQDKASPAGCRLKDRDRRQTLI